MRSFAGARGRARTCACADSARDRPPAQRKASVSQSWGDRVTTERGHTTDRLHDLGAAQQYNINVDHGQSAKYLDSLFTGGFLGKKSDIADGSLRYEEFRTFNNIVGDYYVAHRFLHKCAMHMAKNYLADKLRSVKVPLILGIWGPKGTGKTFQTELSFKKMKVEPVITSSGELESEVAGRPGLLIRQRYRKAADMSRVRGIMSALIVNDIDAGLGRFEGVQCTVNNQVVVSTLMNICDDPTRVSIGEVWKEKALNIRIPIFVTGNDFSTLFAPLIRDGRMDKFFWEPTMEEKVHMVYQMYKDDTLSFEDVARLIQRFGNQSLDFFGAIRASTYDDQILSWVKNNVVEGDLTERENMAKVMQCLLHKEELPEFEPVDLTLDALVQEGERLVYEQEMVNSLRLSDEYMSKQYGSGSMIGFGG